MRPPRSTSTAYSSTLAFGVDTLRNATRGVRPTAVLGFGPMRLRTLSEAECYARCYGGTRDENVTVLRSLPARRVAATSAGESLRERFEERLDARGPEAEAA